MADIQLSSQSRVFLIPGGAAPTASPEYASLGRATAFSQSFGDITPIRVPSRKKYGKFDIAAVVQGQADLPGLSVEYRMQKGLSAALKAAQDGCPVDVQIHSGSCQDPSDFDRGWSKIQILETGYITNYGTSDLGAFDGDQNEAVDETLDYMGMLYYEVVPVTAAKQGESVVTDELIRVVIADSITCGNCGVPSDGTQVAFALQAESSGSPGLGAKVFWTKNGGSTWTASAVTSGSITESVTDMVIQGPYVVVAAGGSNDRLHYCLIADMLKGEETWRAVTTGIVAAGSPKRFIRWDSENTWLLGDGGYIYKMTDAPKGVTVLSAGDLTVQNLLAGHTPDGVNILITGALNVIIVSSNGGKSFRTISGPSAQAAVSAQAAYCMGLNQYMVGYADGDVYYTNDGGVTWNTVSIDPCTAVYDIQASTKSVLWIAVQTLDGEGDVYRSVNGGNTFPSLFQTTGSAFPLSDIVRSIAVTPDNVNVAYAAGLASNAADGLLVKIA